MPSGVYERQKGKHGRPKGIPSNYKKVRKTNWREVGITLRDTVIGAPYLMVEQGTRSPRTSDEVPDQMETY